MLKVVYDTNIIISAALKEKGLPALLLSLALKGKVRLFLSQALLEEYEGVLKRPKFKLDKKEVEKLVGQIKKKAIEVKPTKTITKIKKDLADNCVLECAQKAKVDFIVTGNKKHFSFKEFGKARIVNSREFILYLFNIS